tara:strand:- start:25 stop:348 length:324 start_codon:yes stop_codon:yes gene_type:complete
MITAIALERLGFDPSSFVLQDDSNGQGTYIAQWNNDQPQPSEAEIETAHSEWQAEFDAQEYARNRKSEYPSLDELIVALWENVVEERAASIVELESLRQAVKARYPK